MAEIEGEALYLIRAWVRVRVRVRVRDLIRAWTAEQQHART
jgi:hypothetical protein